jgi:hypothetical protein
MSFSFVTEKAGKLACGLLTAGACLLGGSAHANIIISEVAPWSSGNSPVGADWFELTNTGASNIDISGWTVDDGSDSFASSLALTGVTSIAAGESVIFVEGDDPSGIAASFKSNWFGSSAPAGLQIGTYDGSGIGLSTGGDGLNIFNGGGVKQFGLTFGASDAASPYQTFDNAAGASGEITLWSQVGVNGAFTAANSTEIGSPGTITSVPEPTSAMLLVLGLVGCGYAARKRVR